MKKILFVFILIVANIALYAQDKQFSHVNNCTIWSEPKLFTTKLIVWADWGEGPTQIKNENGNPYEVKSTMEYINKIYKNGWEISAVFYNQELKLVHYVMTKKAPETLTKEKEN
jgi:hypothetical protein